MDASWDVEALQAEFRRRERMKDDAADECRRKARAGDDNYRHFHDEERAEQMVAMFLKTTAALMHRDTLLAYLTELRQAFKGGGHLDKSVFDGRTYRRAAVKCIDREIRRFTIA